MSLVLDCSVTMSWCFDDESDSFSESILKALESKEAQVPAIWPLEVCNVLLVGERRKRLTPADSSHFIDLLNELPITIDEGASFNQREILSLSRAHQLSSYDATYVELAMRKGLPLVTKDKALLNACKKIGIKTKV